MVRVLWCSHNWPGVNILCWVEPIYYHDGGWVDDHEVEQLMLEEDTLCVEAERWRVHPPRQVVNRWRRRVSNTLHSAVSSKHALSEIGGLWVASTLLKGLEMGHLQVLSGVLLPHHEWVANTLPWGVSTKLSLGGMDREQLKREECILWKVGCNELLALVLGGVELGIPHWAVPWASYGQDSVELNTWPKVVEMKHLKLLAKTSPASMW